MTLHGELSGGGLLLASFIAGAYCGWMIKWGYWEWRRFFKIAHRKLRKWEAR